jgi:uroporphyrinogen-III synthase/DNA-binding Lrp family transcriptional regulator
LAKEVQTVSLQGKVVAVVRPQDQAEEFAEEIKALGGTPYVAPLIEVKPSSKPEGLYELIRNVVSGKANIIIFMSRNGVRLTFEATRTIGLARYFKAALERIMVVAVGPKTRGELEALGLGRLVMPDEYSSQGVVKILEKVDLRNKTIAIPRAQGIDKTLRLALEKLGARVIEAAAYEVSETKDKSLVKRFLEDLVDGKIDVVAFTSPSTVRSLLKNAENLSLMDKVEDRLRRIVIASIGPTTKKALEDSGFNAQIVPSRYTVLALAKEIADYFQKRIDQSGFNELDELDHKILYVLQYSYPLVTNPWDFIAEEIGIDSQTLISKVKRLIDLGIIRKIGPFPDLKKIGFKASTLVGIKAPQEKIGLITEILNRLSSVSHSYLREHQYNLWFTVTAKDAQEIRRIVALVKTSAGLMDEEILNLPVVRMFKTDVRFSTK